jgi:hypothetical protein
MGAFKDWLPLVEGKREGDDLARIIEESRAIAKPKAFYKMSFIDDRGSDFVVIDGITFHSRVMSVNLENAHRVFPYLATCGLELEEWGSSNDDMLFRVWAETIKEWALVTALGALQKDLNDRYNPGQTASMNPGSLEDWPIEEQGPLFELLGEAKELAGVRLMESYLMIPTKTVSGLHFPTEVSFQSCQLCPRERCQGRRADYDSGLYEKRYQEK